MGILLNTEVVSRHISTSEKKCDFFQIRAKEGCADYTERSPNTSRVKADIHRTRFGYAARFFIFPKKQINRSTIETLVDIESRRV